MTQKTRGVCQSFCKEQEEDHAKLDAETVDSGSDMDSNDKEEEDDPLIPMVASHLSNL